MEYLVISNYECVDAGDLQNEDEGFAVFFCEHQPPARYADRLRAMKSSVRDEIDLITRRQPRLQLSLHSMGGGFSASAYQYFGRYRAPIQVLAL